ncbi:phage Gp37/Gp68 family protein [Aminobacter aminovorans]|uniref:phage Gp37/Gp68 family protein n=1 Tax=Aminobacter aminovorans TaxID=83263 RepID=UPI0028548ED2|nr:phage Gp37/Gp68 family protein [Aminobacter aminovorans]MDR7220325.1 protein gp37 [Aminobacter aminovorans]
MADHSLIEWTDATWQPITGCAVISPGCTNCYAMKLAGTRLKHLPSRVGLTRDSKAGPVWNGQVRFNEQWLDQPLRWRRPRKIFVVAHGDLFAEQVPDEWIDRVFAIMALSPHHIFQVLTKRPDRMRKYLAASRASRVAVEALEVTLLERLTNPNSTVGSSCVVKGDIRHLATWPLPNVWLGVSVEDQPRANERREPVQSLAEMGWLTWVSYEPAIGPVAWNGWDFLRWIVSGGESGDRPTHPDWHRHTRDFSAVHGIPYLFKQWGSWAPGEWAFDLDDHLHFLPDDDHVPVKGLDDHERAKERMIWSDNARTPEGRGYLNVGKKAAGRLLDGVEHNAMPEAAR